MNNFFITNQWILMTLSRDLKLMVPQKYICFWRLQQKTDPGWGYIGFKGIVFKKLRLQNRRLQQQHDCIANSKLYSRETHCTLTYSTQVHDMWPFITFVMYKSYTLCYTLYVHLIFSIALLRFNGTDKTGFYKLYFIIFFFKLVPVPCIVGEWTEWTDPTDEGIIYRSREVLQYDMNNGDPCPRTAENDTG